MITAAKIAATYATTKERVQGEVSVMRLVLQVGGAAWTRDMVPARPLAITLRTFYRHAALPVVLLPCVQDLFALYARASF